mmetsp:Transcript_22426/g.47116  ORF Transcript_22426/g.47116 Transcript_22426/m.47116 type:complete len:207 (+) Transcript_22426:89-709(+)|eukprot:CAMPEP_0168211306 /NCGR_PEP_ID=MMETSP0140_2-20121125/3642_1 /TAXON_ID=44445 /ORGANISM="Pseudo-nitzschia australis, Strain 10249 10 AB" /LENGTH=206 /DNA_ID=CAMNT_0008137983 /DNA_START=49 /DNA_END=669 /DNA_ORIENTATION=+
MATTTTDKPVPVTNPTKTIPWEEYYEKTDNANKLMDRVWYCIACTDKSVAEQSVFWEHWYWKKGQDKKDLTTSTLKGCNHTLTIDSKGKEADYPIWPLKFTKDSMKMYPAIDLKCFVIAPFGLAMQPIVFPTNDSRKEFRVDFCEAMGQKMYFVFVLDPNISEEDKKKNFDALEKENGVLREWLHDVKWAKDYQLGSAGEPDINPK